MPANVIAFTDGVSYYQALIIGDPAAPIVSPATTIQLCAPETWVFDYLGETSGGTVLRTCNVRRGGTGPDLTSTTSPRPDSLRDDTAGTVNVASRTCVNQAPIQTPMTTGSATRDS